MASEQHPVIAHLDRVGLRYAGRGADVLHDLSFTVAQGSFSCLTGHSGAGKTSLLRLLYLGVKPSAGRMQLFGQDVGAMTRDETPLIRRRIGVVFQDYRLLPHLTLFDNVALPLRLAGFEDAKTGPHVSELLRWVGLAGRDRDYPANVSGGEQQRAAVARAVVNSPALVLADEPTGNLDEANAVRILKLFTELNRAGTAVILASHQRRIIRALQQPVFELSQGRLVQAMTPTPQLQTGAAA